MKSKKEMKKPKITKGDVLTFLGLVLTTAVTTFISRLQSKSDIEDTVAAVLAEERKQIAAEEAKNAKA